MMFRIMLLVGGLLFGTFVSAQEKPNAVQFVTVINTVAVHSEQCARSVKKQVLGWYFGDDCKIFRESVMVVNSWDLGTAEQADAYVTELLVDAVTDRTLTKDDVTECLYNMKVITHNSNLIKEMVKASNI